MSSIKKYVSLIENELKLLLSKYNQPQTLVEAIKYVVLSGGKRIRPLLVLSGGMLNNVNNRQVINIAMAIELIHCYSLVHDDLPAMDNDDIRRGLPTCHRKYNEATAILVGDALQALAFELISLPNELINPEAQLKITNLIAVNSGVMGLVGGQALDLDATQNIIQLEELQNIHLMKTGALIKASILSGYLSGSDYVQSQYDKLEIIAGQIGLLFQIVDDIIDITETTDTLGKTANKDLISGKSTYVSILGVDVAKSKAKGLYENIITQLDVFTGAEFLKEITAMIYKRNC